MDTINTVTHIKFSFWKFYVAGGALFTRYSHKRDLSKTVDFAIILDKCYRAISDKNEKMATIHYAKLVWFYLKPLNNYSFEIRRKFKEANLNAYEMSKITNTFSKTIEYRGEFYHTLNIPFHGKNG